MYIYITVAFLTIDINTVTIIDFLLPYKFICSFSIFMINEICLTITLQMLKYFSVKKNQPSQNRNRK